MFSLAFAMVPRVGGLVSRHSCRPVARRSGSARSSARTSGESRIATEKEAIDRSIDAEKKTTAQLQLRAARQKVVASPIDRNTTV